MKDKVKDKRNS